MSHSSGEQPGRVRPSAADIYESVKHDASEELRRAPTALAFSGLLAGATVGFSGLASAAVIAALGHTAGARLIGALAYPIGFIAVIVGRAQLFTENTLYPVILVLDERRHVAPTLRLWVIVFFTNVLGALLFALLVTDSGAFGHHVVNEVVRVGSDRVARPWSQTFWSAVVGGWLLALVAWMIEASTAVIGQVLLIYLLTFVIGIAELDHCVSTTAEVLAAAIQGHTSAAHVLPWLGTVVFGNILGGVVIVALLNYGQVRTGG